MSLVDAENFIEQCPDKSYRIGVITEDIPNVFGYNESDIVVFRAEGDRDTFIVEIPSPAYMITSADLINGGNLSYGQIVNVPDRYICPLDDELDSGL